MESYRVHPYPHRRRLLVRWGASDLELIMKLSFGAILLFHVL